MQMGRCCMGLGWFPLSTALGKHSEVGLVISGQSYIGLQLPTVSRKSVPLYARAGSLISGWRWCIGVSEWPA